MNEDPSAEATPVIRSEKFAGGSSHTHVSGDLALTISSSSRTLIVSGGILIASGILHLLIWSLSGEPWEGSVSWRKPILFGVSGGLTLVSMGYLLRLLPPWNANRWVATSLALAMLGEVALITLQQWRGVPSHFNRATVFDGTIDTLITILISVVVVGIGVLAIQALIHLSTKSAEGVAWLSGLGFLLLSCLLGFLISIYGAARVEVGEDPTVFGDSGVVKFPHGIAIHAIQWLPLVCWILTVIGVQEKQRRMVIWSMNASIALQLLYGLVQTFSGRGRMEPDMWSASLLVLAIVAALPFAALVLKAATDRINLRGWSYGARHERDVG